MARGDLTSRHSVDVANLMIAGINMGLYYAKMFGIPEREDVNEMHDAYHNVTEAMDKEIKLLLADSDQLKSLLDYEDLK